MGIDLKRVNSIVHYGAPWSLEDYFQESGRGGRQRGDSANSVVYWKPADCPVRKEPSSEREHEVIEVRKYLRVPPCDSFGLLRPLPCTARPRSIPVL